MNPSHNNAPLAGQVALVTGAGRGIGAAIAAKIAALGATVVLCGRSRVPLDSTAAAIAKTGGHAEAVACDVTDLRSVEAAAAHLNQTLGRLDILVNNAGMSPTYDELINVSEELYDKVVIPINLTRPGTADVPSSPQPS